MVSRIVTVGNDSGLHVRPARVLVKAAETCTSRVEILYKYNIINAKSLLNVLAAAIAKGEQIEIRCSGPSEQKDLETILEAMKHLE